MRFREEVINIHFANILERYGLVASPETIHAKGRPDVLIVIGGLKLIIEGRFMAGPDLIKDVKKRVEIGLKTTHNKQA